MKKKTKKLVLARETVRNLDLVRHRVAGGGYTDYDSPCTQTCNGCSPYTFDHTCTTPDYTAEFSCNCNNTVIEPQTRRNC
jgi:hypothetical protein